MMETAPLSPFRQEFARRAEAKRDEERRNLSQLKKKDEDRAEEHRQGGDDENLLLAVATEVEIAAFDETLDRYDTATVEALQENEEQLTKVRQRLNDMLDKAYTTPDGRKVFESEDGIHVFDQNGVEIKDVTAEEIEDFRPKWEAYHSTVEQEGALTQQRTELVQFQDELDVARQRADDGHLTKKELADLQDQLKRDAPLSVQGKLPTDPDASPVADIPQPEVKHTLGGVRLEMPSIPG